MPPPLPLHLLAQQVLALTLQEGGVGSHLWQQVIGRLPVFAGAIADGTAQRIVDHLVETGMLIDDHGLLSVGPQGEKSYGYRHFLDLTSMFTSPPLFLVRHGANTIGQLDPTALLTPDRSFATVLLAGRSWHITSIDWKRRFAWVEPATTKGRSRWVGAGQPWSAELSASTRSVLCGFEPEGVVLTQRAKDQLAETRADFTWARPDTTSVVVSNASTRWWTWAGQRANATLLDALGDLRADRGLDNLMIGVDPDRGTMAEIRERLADLDPSALPVPSAASDFADGMKFSDCLPDDIALAVAAARLADPDGVSRVLKELASTSE